MDDLEWQPVRKQRAYEQVVERIEERIREGRLRPGDRLPPERELGELLGVGRPAVREALRVLEALGIVSARTGRGDNAGSRIVDQADVGFASLLRLHIGLSGFSITEVLGTRIMLEAWAAKTAATRRTQDDIVELRALVTAMADSRLGGEAFQGLDTEFHVRIATASGNRLIASFMQALRASIKREMNAVYKETEMAQSLVFQTLRREHEDILECIVQQDGDQAGELVTAHITSFYGDLLYDRNLPVR